MYSPTVSCSEKKTKVVSNLLPANYHADGVNRESQDKGNLILTLTLTVSCYIINNYLNLP